MVITIIAYALASFVVYSSAHPVHVDPLTQTFRDGANRTLLWHGVNFVEKSAPFYPNISAETVSDLRAIGANVVRLGVMMPGLFPTADGVPSDAYLSHIEAAIDLLWESGVATIIDLHQDVLGPAVCGEGCPDWIVGNVSALGALPIPQPLSFNKSVAGSCGAVGPLKFIGWSELYLTDACGKAFQRVFDGEGTLGAMFEKYWATVSARLAGRPGVLLYEMMNEPWVGDHVSRPALLLQQGLAEQRTVGPWMRKMHETIRRFDPSTPVLFSPAEVNNRLMRPVGYENGFLGDPRGTAMAFHTYCVIGTDAAGPVGMFQKALCHTNDGLQLSRRVEDLARLRTAGFVTEFGGVSDSDTGRAEVRHVASILDGAAPGNGSKGRRHPLSWTFWSGVPASSAYRREIARSFPKATAGHIQALSFDAGTGLFELRFSPSPGGGQTEIVLATDLHYAAGFETATDPTGCCSVERTADGIAVNVSAAVAALTSSITIRVSRVENDI